MTRTLLIDGDMYLYQVAAKDQVTVEFDGVPMSTADPETAISNLDNLFDNFIDRMKADVIVIALSDPDKVNFRKDILPTYKSGRSKSKDPILRTLLQDHIIDNYGCTYKPALEGDDVLGIWATAKGFRPGDEKIVVSGDKDLKFTIPGKHWNPARDYDPRTKTDVVTTITEEEADYGHLLQTLMGDPVDGYTGIPGVGPVKAEKALAWEGSDRPWDRVVHAYEAAGLTEDDALVQARVARILRASDYDFKRSKPILWSP